MPDPWFDTLHSLPSSVFTRWIVLSVLFLIILIWQLREIRRLRKASIHTTDLVRALFRTINFRSWFLYVLIVVFLLAVMAYDIKLNKLHVQKNESDSQLLLLQKQEAERLAKATAAVQLLNTSPAVQPQEAAEDSKPKTLTAADIFGSGGANKKERISNQILDEIKLNYEDAFIMYFYMQKCQKAALQDFHLINSSLAYSLAAANAESRIQQDILNAARGSYYEMYSKSSCSDKNLPQLEKRYREYIQQIIATTRPL